MTVSVGTLGSWGEQLMYSPQSQMAHILGSPLHYCVLFNTTQTAVVIKCQTKISDRAEKDARYNMLERNAVLKIILKMVTLLYGRKILCFDCCNYF